MPPHPLASPAATRALTVDPPAIAAAAAPLLAVAAELRVALPALQSSWTAAGQALAGRRSGDVLQACQPGALAALWACAEAMQAYARSLQQAAEAYRESEAAAVPLQSSRPSVTIPAQRAAG
jgi:uncharacterized protein YukE